MKDHLQLDHLLLDSEYLTPTLIVPVLPPDSIIAVDTETSGLHVDDGARVSVVSIAWWDSFPCAPQHDDNPLVPPRKVRSWVYAFDHGYDTPLGPKHVDPQSVAKKSRKNMTPSLFEEMDAAPNLPPHDFKVLMDWLTQHSLVFQNAKFDLHILRTGLRGRESEADQLPDLSYNVQWDTQVVNPVIWPEFPTSLKPTASRLWGVEEADAQRQLQAHLKSNGYRFDLAPWSLLEPYAAQDAELTLRLYQHHLQLIDEGEPSEDRITTLEVCEREVDFAIALFRMERRGVGYNAKLSVDEAERLQRAADEAEARFRKIVMDAFPGRYTSVNNVPPLTEHSARAFWFGKPEDFHPGLGKFPIKMTDKGTASVAKDVVKVLIERDVPGAVEYERYNQCATAASMWYASWGKLCGPADPYHHPPTVVNRPRLRTNYRQSRTQEDSKANGADSGGTISGRVAVERIQLQAIPHTYQLPELNPPLTPVRSLFIPDPGYQLWELDLKQAEFRGAAGIANCKRMKDAIASGDWDAHDSTTELMFKVTKDDPKWKFLRNVAKRLNFGVVYGAGAYTIASQIQLYTGVRPKDDDMQEWLNTFRSTFPELGKASRLATREAETKKRVKLVGGRERWFSPFEQTHKAFNAKIQGGVAEMMKVAMIDIESTMPNIMLLQIHDSIIVELRHDEAQEQVQMLKKLLCDPFTEAFNVPFEADAGLWGHHG